jgi:hypothetical protein
MSQLKIFNVSIAMMRAQKNVHADSTDTRIGSRKQFCAPAIERHHPRKRMIQYSSTSVLETRGCGVLDAPPSRGMTANDSATRATIRKAALLVARHRGQLGHVLQQDPAAL